MKQYDIDPKGAKIRIISRFGCGTSLFGKPSLLDRRAAFRGETLAEHGLDGDDTSEVKYLFFTLFYWPIYPLGCYRMVNRISREYEYALPIYDITTHHIIVGEEEWNWREVASIYFHYWILIPGIIALLFFVISHGTTED